jgi:hypothetical protein
MQYKQGQRAAQEAALGPPGERAARDGRTQTIMTVRPLLFENALTSCMAVLLGRLTRKVSLECLLKILCERSGSRVETDSQGISWVNPAGLAVPSHRLLARIVDGLCAAVSEETDSGPPQRHTSLTMLSSWADRRSIFWEGCQKSVQVSCTTVKCRATRPL